METFDAQVRATPNDTEDRKSASLAELCSPAFSNIHQRSPVPVFHRRLRRSWCVTCRGGMKATTNDSLHKGAADELSARHLDS
ncbi:unnamed protein product [Gadus morhua 'NCC']